MRFTIFTIATLFIISCSQGNTTPQITNEINTNNTQIKQDNKVKVEEKNMNNIDNQKTFTKEEIKNIVLKHSWLSEKQVYWIVIKEDYEYWKLFYEVDFFENNTNKKFEYKVDSSNWQIIESEIDFN